MKVLLAEDDADTRELIAFLLESRFSAYVLEASSGNEAIGLLEKEPGIDLVICDYRMPDGTGADVCRYLLSKKSKIPFILCSGTETADHDPVFAQYPITGSVEKPFVMKPLIGLVAPLARANEVARSAVSGMPGYVRVRLRSLEKMSTLASNLYLKLGEEKFVKIANNGDHMEKGDLDRLAEKGVEYLHIPREAAEHLLDRLTKEILTVKAAKSRTAGESFQLSENIQHVVHELNQDLGFTPQIQALAKANVELALSLITAHPQLHDLLSGLLLGKDSYITAHSVALAHTSCGISLQMGWGNEQNLFKLALASFLHDITLMNEDLAQVQTEEALQGALMADANRFSPEEVAAFRAHPKEASLLAARIEDIPPDVDLIVAQHHERPDGSGFPTHINYTRIVPLASVFIVAHDVVSAFWQMRGGPEKFSIEKFLESKEQDYRAGFFKKIAVAMAAGYKPT